MSETKMVCKHCGGDDFFANVTVYDAWVNSTGVFVGDDGKPHFEPNGSPEDTYSYDIDDYQCNGCRKRAGKLADLVVAPPPAGGDPIAPCGRCDHGRLEHPELGWNAMKDSPWTRGPMPCEHEGCDCRDYYDLALANAGLEAARAA